MSKSKLKKCLLSMTHEQAVNVVMELYDGCREAKNWLEFYLQPDIEAETEKCRKLLYSQFYGRRDEPRDPKFSECNKIVTAFSKLVNDAHATADIMLYYVEVACSQPAQFGDFPEAYYTAVENNFRKALKHISGHGLMREYDGRLRLIISSVAHCGYGFPDVLWQFFMEYAYDE